MKASVIAALAGVAVALPQPQSGEAIPGTCTNTAWAKASNTKLPDMFKMNSGTRTATKADWQCRQQEIFQMIQDAEMGAKPPKPSSVAATYSASTLTINVSDGGKSISFTAKISGNTGSKVPAIIAYGGSSIPIPAGVATITFNNDDMAAQQDKSSRGKGKFYNLYGSSHSAGAMSAWAWGVSRIIDALESTTGHNIDTTKIGVTGCSRNGKGALVAGAFDDRIALTIPQESGSGGAGCWRLSDAENKSKKVQTASEIVGENCWFGSAFNTYAQGSVNNLPHDHHMLAALVSPRPMYVIENTIDWLSPQSAFGCMKTAHKAWEALGVPDNMGFSQTASHNHCQFPSSQQAELTAFISKFLLGKDNGSTSVMKTATQTFTDSQWVDWTVPSLT